MGDSPTLFFFHMNRQNLTVVVVGVILLMAMSIISFMVYDAMSQKNQYYTSQEFSVEGTVDGVPVTGTCISEWNNHSGAGDIIVYLIELEDSDSKNFKFYIYFDDSGSPSDNLYKHGVSDGSWIYSEDSMTINFHCVGPMKIDYAEIMTKEATLFLQEVAI